MVLKPGREEAAQAIFDKWELDFAVIGTVTDSGRLILTMGGRAWADLPVRPLVDQAPSYARPYVSRPPPAPLPAGTAPLPESIGTVLLRLISSPDLASRRWIWDQYDSTVMADTMHGPGAADAAIVRVHGTGKALAMTTDCTPRYCLADPRQGGMQAVAEAWRNLTAVGAKPLALTDNMNFGNPEKPLIMGQFVGCIDGMAAACRALDFPVISGNVSLYNETNGQAILPTPTIGGVGLLTDAARHATPAFKAEGETILLLGDPGSGHLGCSLYLREIHGREEGPPPTVDLMAERRTGDCIRQLIEGRAISACHDVSDGGLLVTVAEMAMASGLGASLEVPSGVVDQAGWLFGEDQGRYVVTTGDPDAVRAAAAAANVPTQWIGRVGGDSLTGLDTEAIPVASLKSAHDSWLPTLMAGSV